MITGCAIWHGDSRKLVSSIDEPVKCIVTDPPYGVDFKSHMGVRPNTEDVTRRITADVNLDVARETFLKVMGELLPKADTECEMYVFTRWDVVHHWTKIVQSLEEPFGFVYKMLLVWDKGYPGLGDIDANWGCGHELILYLKKGRREVPFRRSGIIAVDKVHPSQHVHPTEKPVPLLERLIEMSTDPGDLVVDPFSGSGPTICAAQNLGRRAVGIELDEDYVKVARCRLAQRVLI